MAQKMSVLSGKGCYALLRGGLAVWSLRFSFILGIASCSHHAVSGTSSQSLSSAVAVMFIPFLQQEGTHTPPCVIRSRSDVSAQHSSFSCSVHEGTLVHAVSVLWQWSNRLTVEVPTALLDWLKKAFTLKTSTSLVRHAYLQAMLGAFKGRSW